MSGPWTESEVRGEVPVRLGVTGTDTGVGKTVVSCALLAVARARGLRIGVMKPFETGVSAAARVRGEAGSSDAELLRAASGVDDAPELICPFPLNEPLAPMVAAQRAGIDIDLSIIDRAFATLSVERDLILVEGAGGLLVPITRTFSNAQMFARLRCELIIVSGNRLGVINHTMLTVRAAEAEGLRVRGVVITELSARDESVAASTNFDALSDLLPHIRCFRFPWVERWTDADSLREAAFSTGLESLLSSATHA